MPILASIYYRKDIIMFVLIDPLQIVLPIVCAVVGLLLGGVLVFLIPVFKISRANKTAKKIIRDAEIKGDHIVKNAQLDGKQTIFEMKQEADKEILLVLRHRIPAHSYQQLHGTHPRRG
jgi:hypothetical protein